MELSQKRITEGESGKQSTRKALSEKEMFATILSMTSVFG